MRTVTLLLVLTLAGCTPAAKSAFTTAITIAVDTCQEAATQNPGPVVTLICAAIDAGAPAVTVLIDSSVWTGMKKDYLAKHGVLPKGVSPITVVIDAGAAVAPAGSK